MPAFALSDNGALFSQKSKMVFTLGANKEPKGWSTALHRAAVNGHTKCVELLLQAGSMCCGILDKVRSVCAAFQPVPAQPIEQGGCARGSDAVFFFSSIGARCAQHRKG